MTDGKKKRKRPGKKGKSRDSTAPSAGGLRLRKLPGGEAVFELVPPPCARARAEDLEEVQAMLSGGEVEVAEDELRWLLDGCPAFLEAHKMLGEIALAEENYSLARSHFGRVYELATAVLPRDAEARLAYARPANQVLFESGKGLAWSLRQMGEVALANEIIRRLLTLDPSDPLNLKAMEPP